MLQRSTLQLLRFHFSFFLVPVYLFALSQVPQVNWRHAALAFVVLHLLVYPSSNGYNSYMDRDETPIGGLLNPMQPTRQLFYVSIIMDVIALLLSLLISQVFTLGILFYIIASRAYSYRGIRLKQYPYTGFLTVFIFQGACIFFITYYACPVQPPVAVPVLPCLASSLLIGGLYPLTQIYQHEQDKADGVRTISYALGKKGTFIFSIGLFVAAAACLFIIFKRQQALNLFYLFLLYTLPVVLFLGYWMYAVWKNEAAADFKRSLWMNGIATACTTAFFTTLILIK